MKMPDTVKLHYLVEVEVPVSIEPTIDSDTHVAAFLIAANTPTMAATRIASDYAMEIYDRLDPDDIDNEHRTPGEETPLADWERELLADPRPPSSPEPHDPAAAYADDGPYAPGGVQTDPTEQVLGDQPEEVTPLDDAPATPPAPKKANKPARRNPAPKKNRGRLSKADSERVNDTIRTALAEGVDDIGEIASRAGVTRDTVIKRIEKHDLRASTAPQSSEPDPPEAPKAPPAPAAAPKPAPSPTPPQATRKAKDQLVPALGAHRRIRSLYAIGYDPDLLNDRLPGDTTVEAVLDAEQITWAVFHDIDVLWRMKRYSPVDPRPGWNVDRSHPKPTTWDNIDDPNEAA